MLAFPSIQLVALSYYPTKRDGTRTNRRERNTVAKSECFRDSQSKQTHLLNKILVFLSNPEVVQPPVLAPQRMRPTPFGQVRTTKNRSKFMTDGLERTASLCVRISPAHTNEPNWTGKRPDGGHHVIARSISP